MTPQLIATIITLVEQLVSDAPELYSKLQEIFSNENPTPADWEALRAEVLAKTYADYVPKSDLPAQSDAPASPAAPVTTPASPAVKPSPAPTFPEGVVVLNH